MVRWFGYHGWSQFAILPTDLLEPGVLRMELAGNTDALQLLNDLDQRQDQVMAELDQLNSRIEKVLELYLESRKTPVASPAQDSESSSKAA